MLADIIYDGVKYENYKFNMITKEIISDFRKLPVVIEQLIDADGYFYVRLYNENLKPKKTKKITLHRLVYQMYNKDEDIRGKHIVHVDGVKLNNNINNLKLKNKEVSTVNIENDDEELIEL